jgi:S1-C subfamily serine protease
LRVPITRDEGSSPAGRGAGPACIIFDEFAIGGDFVYRLSFRQIVLVAGLAAVLATVATLFTAKMIGGGLGDLAAFSPDPASEPVALADPSVATDEQNNIEIYRALSPAVVNVTAEARIDTFFGPVPQRGSGSGSIIDVDGQRVILTNYHVVREAASVNGRGSSIEVSLADKSTYKASIVGVDPDHAIAVLRVDAPAGKLRTAVPLGSSSNLQVGQKVLAIGNPFGLDQTLTTGIISALERPLSAPSGWQISGVIQTDAAINPGNSGGPLLNSRGELIGINTAILSESGGNVGIGFAVPVDIAKRVIPELLTSGRVARAFLGIGYQPVNDRIRRYFDLEADAAGLLVTEVQAGSPADRAGLRRTTETQDGYSLGDIVVSIDGKELKTSDDLSLVLNQKRPGDTVQLVLLRGGQTQRVTVTLAEAPRQQRL